jgi:poly(beta-D-mannuronate) lyase
MINHLIVYCIAMSLFSFLTSAASAQAIDLIQSPYAIPVKTVEQGYNDPRHTFKGCNPPKAVPPKNLEFYSKYDQTDPTRSKIDANSQEEYTRATRQIVTYEQSLIRMSNNYIKGKAKNSAYAACTLEWLTAAAKAKSFSGKANKTGVAVRQWGLATVSSAYIQIKDDPFLDKRRVKIVEAWLKGLAESVIEDYPYNSPLKSRHNNHLYWAAWSVTATSVALNNSDLLLWGVHQFKLAMLQINPDGTLPLELAREGKALHYHLFSIAPLVMIAETAAQNGINLYDFRQGYFHRLVDQSLKSLEDPSYLESVATKPQNMEGISASQVVWLEAYNLRYPSAIGDKWLSEHRPLASRRVGGSTTLLYKK